MHRMTLHRLFRSAREFRLPRLLGVMICVATVLAGCATPAPAETHRRRGDHAMSINDHEAAAAEYEQVVARFPGDWSAQYKLARCYLELDRPAEARRALEIAYTQKPDRPEVADAFAEALYEIGATERLFALLNERAEGTQSVHAWLRLAHYAMLTEDPDSARVAIETAIEIDDGQRVKPYLAAAEYAESIGDRAMTIRRLRQAYGIDPDNDRISEWLRSLGEVPGPTIALPPGR